LCALLLASDHQAPYMATDSFYGEEESVARAVGGWGELVRQ
jgi:hypothetical protein